MKHSKSFIALATTVALGIGIIGLASSAEASHRHNYGNSDYDFDYAYDYGYGYPRYRYRYPVRASGRSHVRWCLNRYRSYNPRTDTFMGYDGRRHYCRSPY